MKILLTGCAGFIGYHVARSLLDRGDQVVGLDSINNYYDVNLKIARLKQLGVFVDDSQISFSSSKYKNFIFNKIDISDEKAIEKIFRDFKFDGVCNLAAQAGVGYSLKNPKIYIDSNITGFLNILEGCRKFGIENLCYASTSSIYGINKKIPFSTTDNTDHPISTYAATKKSNELMAHTYSSLFKIRTTGLRFFTVYGPWGRPDMALFKFVKAALNNETIKVYNFGDMERDFTYIDDIKECVLAAIDNPAKSNDNWEEEGCLPNSSTSPFKIYNVGNSKPISILEFISKIEEVLQVNISKDLSSLQLGDVKKTYADISNTQEAFGYTPKIDITQGIKNFVNWYKEFYK